MRVVPINWTDLEIAFERNSPQTESFLDMRTGDVITVTQGALDYSEQRAKVTTGGAQMIRVDPVASREQYKWMERFVVQVTDAALRERLVIAIDGKGAFRRFKDVLLNYPVERERWFTYRSELLHWAMKKWLEKEQLEAQNPAPWGEPHEPPKEEEEPVLERQPGGEGPGEILRRQAKELIDQVPAVELPAAIAFLDYLKERGVQELVRVHPIPVKRTAA
jgi:hypothetical protein